MKLDGDQCHTSLAAVHEYPDPDLAAHITQYPWVGEKDNYVQLQSGNERSEYWHDGSQFGPRSVHLPTSDSDTNESIHRSTSFPDFPIREVGCDPDYLLSEDNPTEDDIISDRNSADSADDPEDFDDAVIPQSLVAGVERRHSGGGGTRRRGGGRRGGLGRGGKGIKRGPRKAVEPTEEFKAFHSQATIAYMEQNYEQAEQLILQAILINPEMYPAHNLLSEIHAARGDEDKAISAAWAAAHTKHRDPEIWSRTARLILERDGNDRDSALRGAIYCINRVIALDKYNIEARYQRATLYHELGHKGRAAMEYEELFKQLPHNTTVLRHLAEIYIELERPERALEHYKSSILYFQILEREVVSSFSWSDVNIVTELYGFQGRYEEGMMQLKSLSRWLLGRIREIFWENFDQDDREWDPDDYPRRVKLPEFTLGEFDPDFYGNGLPLELRIKLGVFRLKAQHPNLEEAIKHFEWLEPENKELGAKLYNFSDLFREAANALRRMQYYHEALRYYEPLQLVDDYMDVSCLFEMALCYKSVGLKAEADNCYNSIKDHDNDNREARTQLVETGRAHGFARHRRSGSRVPKRSKKISEVQSSNTPMLLGPRLLPEAIKRQVVEKVQIREEEIHALFLDRQTLSAEAWRGDEDSREDWMGATKTLLQCFRENKVFYPLDKHHKFYGYSKEARTMASRPKYELDAIREKSESIFQNPDGDRIIVPDDYCGIKFEAWLDVFLEYALMLAVSRNVGGAYQIIKSAFRANVYYHSRQSLFLIHVCWFTCALLCNDDETLCNIARWFMREYQFVTDGYRLFSVLNKLCDSENSWFNCGPSQKYILRQLKAVDFSVLSESRRKSPREERASCTIKDSDGFQIQAEDMDIALLMLYGHVLHAGKSYAYAVNYYLRALALDPTNPMIKLSLALGYIHYALNRRAENRHYILMQGLAFLMVYYDERAASKTSSEKQEAEYNVAHVYHLLGLTHLAVPYYERCLGLSPVVHAKYLTRRIEDFACEAAANLQRLWAASGNAEKAREITETWMIL